MYENGIAWMVGHATQTSVERELAMRDRAQARALREAMQGQERRSRVSAAASSALRRLGRVAGALGIARRPVAEAMCCVAA
jgi:transcription initiation factor TFIIIB Brf1 subunit/transcription initiation factor TFIIB